MLHLPFCLLMIMSRKKIFTVSADKNHVHVPPTRTRSKMTQVWHIWLTSYIRLWLYLTIPNKSWADIKIFPYGMSVRFIGWTSGQMPHGPSAAAHVWVQLSGPSMHVFPLSLPVSLSVYLHWCAIYLRQKMINNNNKINTIA